MTRTVNRTTTSADTNRTAILMLESLRSSEIALAGGKAVNLGEMMRAGLPVPPGFVVSTDAYRAVIAERNLDAAIQETLSQTAVDNAEELERAATRIQALFGSVTIPAELTAAITEAYRSLGDNVSVAVRSSATAEDLPGLSFAGQYDTFLNAVGVDELLLNASWGLGEAIVSGDVNPDQWVIDKESGRIVETTIARKEQMTIRTSDGLASLQRRKPRRRDPQLLEVLPGTLEIGAEVLGKVRFHHFQHRNHARFHQIEALVRLKPLRRLQVEVHQRVIVLVLLEIRDRGPQQLAVALKVAVLAFVGQWVQDRHLQEKRTMKIAVVARLAKTVLRGVQQFERARRVIQGVPCRMRLGKIDPSGRVPILSGNRPLQTIIQHPGHLVGLSNELVPGVGKPYSQSDHLVRPPSVFLLFVQRFVERGSPLQEGPRAVFATHAVQKRRLLVPVLERQIMTRQRWFPIQFVAPQHVACVVVEIGLLEAPDSYCFSLRFERAHDHE